MMINHVQSHVSRHCFGRCLLMPKEWTNAPKVLEIGKVDQCLIKIRHMMDHDVEVVSDG